MLKRFRQFYKQINNLKSRLLLQIFVSALIIIATVCMISLNLIGRYFENNAKNGMTHIANTIKDYDLSGTGFYSAIAELEGRYNFYIEIYDGDELIYTSRINDSMYTANADSDLSEEILKPRIMRILSHEDTDDGSYYEVRQEYYGTAKYLVYGTFYTGGRSVVLYDSLDIINSTASTVEKILVNFVVLILFVMLFSVYIYLASFILPLTQISRITRHMAKLDFSETCPGYRISELGELSGNINYLSSTLNAALGDLKDKNEQLEKEIAKERGLEQMRKEFISNASHELKTPIAIIQGYAEGAKLGARSGISSEEYIDVIINEAEKMNKLVVRMLDVSMLESGLKLRVEEFNIYDLFAEQISSFSPLLSDAKISLRINIDRSFRGQGDIQLLCTVMNNYVSNAISHIDGDRIISISAVRNDENYRVSVFNTGKPIAEDDIDKIWISFYRADKARSREKSRFGLGLSIVSLIQDTHKQKYGVINRENGVEFWFDIEAAPEKSQPEQT